MLIDQPLHTPLTAWQTHGATPQLLRSLPTVVYSPPTEKEGRKSPFNKIAIPSDASKLRWPNNEGQRKKGVM
jgi:hypothetical protein